MKHAIGAAAVVGALLAAGGCEEIDDTFVVEIATVRPAMAHPGLGTQIVSTDPGKYRIQAVEWRVVEKPPGANATDGLHLDLDGVGINLTCVDPTGQCSNEPCSFLDTAVASPRVDGRCGAGVVVDGLPLTAPGVPAQLDVAFVEVRLYRLRPFAVELATKDDWDGDGVDDPIDNCVLIPNSDQRDTGMKGFGDACAIFEPLAGRTLLDSDADGVPDLRDNCPDTPNRDQADAGKPFGSIQVPDGIGDACTHREEEAVVNTILGGAPMGLEFEKTLSEFTPAVRANSWLTLDYSEAFLLESCTWGAVTGSCPLDAGAVTMCRDLQGGSGCF